MFAGPLVGGVDVLFETDTFAAVFRSLDGRWNHHESPKEIQQPNGRDPSWGDHLFYKNNPCVYTELDASSVGRTLKLISLVLRDRFYVPWNFRVSIGGGGEKEPQMWAESGRSVAQKVRPSVQERSLYPVTHTSCWRKERTDVIFVRNRSIVNST